MSVKNEEVLIENNVVNDLKEEVIAETVDKDTLNELKSLMKSKKSKDMPPKIVETKKKSLNFGVVGSGQGGSRICEIFYNLGYPAVTMNTATQDLDGIKMPEANKLLLQYGIGGSAKNTDFGEKAAFENKEAIMDILSEKLKDVQVLVFTTSLGGGSGAGSHSVVLDILKSTGLPIVVITVLPMSNEDAQTKQNALNTLSSLAKMAQNKDISNLIVVDNAKLEAIYADVSTMNFFKVGNEAIVRPLDAFNYFSSQPSNDKALDPMEWAKLLTDGEGLSIYGELTIDDYEDQTAIAKAVLENHENGLLASGFDLAQAKYAGMIISASEEVWSKIPRVSVDYAVEMVKEAASGVEAVFRGSYVDNTLGDSVKVYSMFSGLGLPIGRVDQLRKDVDADKIKLGDRAKARTNNLTLDTGKDQTVSKADEVRAKIAKNNSTFAKNFGSGGSLDFRKK